MKKKLKPDCGLGATSSYVWRSRCRCVTCSGKREEANARQRQRWRLRHGISPR